MDLKYYGEFLLRSDLTGVTEVLLAKLMASLNFH